MTPIILFMSVLYEYMKTISACPIILKRSPMEECQVYFELPCTAPVYMDESSVWDLCVFFFLFSQGFAEHMHFSQGFAEHMHAHF